jgi:hypothetical protein
MMPGKIDALYRDAANALAFKQPHLGVVIFDGILVVEGSFLLSPLATDWVDHAALKKYQIRVEISEKYRDDEPLDFELEGAFPHQNSHHAYPEGRCCTLVWEPWVTTAQDISIGAFFDGPLRNFFLSQHCVELGQDWPFGEQAHGARGLIDAYADRLGCRPEARDVRQFLKGLIKLQGRKALPVFWRCPCESGKNIGNCCHRRLSRLVAEISPGVASRMLDRLSEHSRETYAVRPRIPNRGRRH